jgi:hypothetical protein
MGCDICTCRLIEDSASRHVAWLCRSIYLYIYIAVAEWTCGVTCDSLSTIINQNSPSHSSALELACLQRFLN